MSEYTKGELKVRVVHGRGWSVQIINTKSKLNMLQDYNLGIAEANAEEIVRRWNSQPDLLKICEEFMEMADNGSAAFDDPEPGSIFLRAEAAIAKATRKA